MEWVEDITSWVASLLGLGLLAALLIAISRVLDRWAKRSEERDGDGDGEDVGEELLGGAADAPRCAYCGYDLRATPTRCPECGQPVIDRKRYLKVLADDWPAAPIAPRKPEPDEELVLLLRTPDSMEAKLLAEQLEARGVACRLDAGPTGGAVPGVREGVTDSEVRAFNGDLEDARAYLRRVQGLPAEPEGAERGVGRAGGC